MAKPVGSTEPVDVGSSSAAVQTPHPAHRADPPAVEPLVQDPAIDAAWLVAALGWVFLLLAVWLVSGVRLGEALRYLGYVVTCVALPGILLYGLASRSRRPGLEHVAAGIPLGFALVVLGFVVCSALGLRRLAFYVSPLIGVGCFIVGMARRALPQIRFRRAGMFRPDVWIAAAIGIAAVIVAAFEFFPLYPLPDQIPPSGVEYQTDIPWHIGNAAGLKSYWPAVDMRMAGRELRYYVGVHIHAAVASWVGGIEVATIFLRLDPSLFVTLLSVQLFWLGREATGRWQGGALTAAIALLASDVSLLHGSTSTLYYNLFVRNLFLSPSYALALLLFIPVVACMGRWMIEPTADTWRLGIGAILLAAVVWVKTPALPVVAAGCAGVALLEIVQRRRLPMRPLLALLSCMVIFGALHRFVVMPGADGYIRVAPLATVGKLPVYRKLFGGSVITAPIRAVIAIVGHAPVAAIGLGAFLAARRAKKDPFTRWLLMVMLAGAGAVLLLDGAGVGQLWFWLYGQVGLVAVAAMGYLDLAARHRARPRPLVATLLGAVVLIAVGSSLARSYEGFAIGMGLRIPRPEALTPARAEAFRWLRDHTPKDAVVAIDHHEHTYGSALSERRFFLENDHFMPTSYLYRFTGGKSGTAPDEPFRALTRRIFEERDEAAVREVRDRWGVRYLLDDKKVNPPMVPLDPSVARRVFSNEAMDVYEVAR